MTINCLYGDCYGYLWTGSAPVIPTIFTHKRLLSEFSGLHFEVAQPWELFFCVEDSRNKRHLKDAGIHCLTMPCGAVHRIFS